jgi:ABC-type glycerol-3-phosphate transport system substrate-binding protein
LETIASNTPTATPVASAQIERLLRIWIPPEFDPQGDGLANRMLKERLDEFAVDHPELRLEVRIKAVIGTGGVLEALAAANVSAPLSLPDLVLMPRPLLESAALKGLLYPYEDLAIPMNDRNWFEYARQLADIKSNVYGIPFAGDTMVLAYHPSLVESTPHNLDSAFSMGNVLLFPAADPQALFTLAIYMEKGGSLQDMQGRPFLDRAVLTSIFEYQQRASLGGVMPYWLAQYSNDEQVWEAFLGNQYPMAITWASTYLKNIPSTTDDLAMAPIPTWAGTPFTLATGWTWALTGQDPLRRLSSVRLAEFLTEKDFMASWTFTAGYLPVRVDALQKWQNTDLRKVVEQISYSARRVPSVELLSSLGPAMELAVVNILKSESDPQTAAQSVVDQVNSP